MHFSSVIIDKFVLSGMPYIAILTNVVSEMARAIASQQCKPSSWHLRSQAVVALPSSGSSASTGISPGVSRAEKL